MSSTAEGSRTGSTRIPEVRVRSATIEDAEAIERIRVETWAATYRGLLPDALIDGLRASPERRREALRRESERAFSLVAEREGVVIGYAFAGAERSGDPDFRGEVYAIYVRPSGQRGGVGRALLRESARRLAAQGLTTLLIWVLRENRIGRSFYERMGGTAVRERPLDEFPGAEGHVEVGYGWRDTAALRD